MLRAAAMALTLGSIALAALAASATGQTALEKAARDEVFRIPTGDAKMTAAIRRARRSLDEFLALAKAPKRNTTDFTVKVPLEGGGKTEYVWLQPFEVYADGRVTGVLNNTPRDVLEHRKGATLTFAKTDIVDWGYYDRDRMMGNFTSCVVLEHGSRADAEAMMAAYGLTCPR